MKKPEANIPLNIFDFQEKYIYGTNKQQRANIFIIFTYLFILPSYIWCPYFDYSWPFIIKMNYKYGDSHLLNN